MRLVIFQAIGLLVLCICVCVCPQNVVDNIPPDMIKRAIDKKMKKLKPESTKTVRSETAKVQASSSTSFTSSTSSSTANPKQKPKAATPPKGQQSSSADERTRSPVKSPKPVPKSNSGVDGEKLDRQADLIKPAPTTSKDEAKTTGTKTGIEDECANVDLTEDLDDCCCEEDEEEGISASISPEIASGFAVVYSWFCLSEEALRDSRVNENAIHQLLNSVKSVRQTHPVIPIYFFTNLLGNSSPLSAVAASAHQINVISTNDTLPPAIQPAALQSSLAFLYQFTKTQSIIYGWQHQLLPELVVYLDINMILAHTTPHLNLLSTLLPLKYYDIAGVFAGHESHESLESHENREQIEDLGWTMSEAVFVVKYSSIKLLQDWQEEYLLHLNNYATKRHGHQQALMRVLEASRTFRIFPLPSSFNYQSSTTLRTSNNAEQANILIKK